MLIVHFSVLVEHEFLEKLEKQLRTFMLVEYTSLYVTSEKVESSDDSSRKGIVLVLGDPLFFFFY